MDTVARDRGSWWSALPIVVLLLAPILIVALSVAGLVALAVLLAFLAALGMGIVKAQKQAAGLLLAVFNAS